MPTASDHEDYGRDQVIAARTHAKCVFRVGSTPSYISLWLSSWSGILAVVLSSGWRQDSFAFGPFSEIRIVIRIFARADLLHVRAFHDVGHDSRCTDRHCCFIRRGL